MKNMTAAATMKDAAVDIITNMMIVTAKIQ